MENFKVFKILFKYYSTTEWPVKHGRVFLVHWKKWLVQCTRLQWHTLDKTRYTRYQKNTAMYNWPPCTWILVPVSSGKPSSVWSPVFKGLDHLLLDYSMARMPFCPGGVCPNRFVSVIQSNCIFCQNES